jgi:hypothetical protein
MLLADDETEIDLRAEGPCFALPVKVERAMSPRAPSVVSRPREPKPTSRTSAYFFIVSAFPRTVSPSLGSCPRQRASSFLLASALFFQCSGPFELEPAEDKARDASDRLLPPERSTYTRTSCVPGSLRGFHRVDIPRSLGLRATDRGTECFTAPVNASADRNKTRAACLPPAFTPRVRGMRTRAWAFFSHGAC